MLLSGGLLFSGRGVYRCQKHVILSSSTFRYDAGAFQHMFLHVSVGSPFRKLMNAVQLKTQGHKASNSSEIPFPRENSHVCLQTLFSRFGNALNFQALSQKGTFLYSTSWKNKVLSIAINNL